MTESQQAELTGRSDIKFFYGKKWYQFCTLCMGLLVDSLVVGLGTLTYLGLP